MVKPPDLDKTFETFSHEVKDFYKSKTITFITWATFWILNISNVITVIYSATPSWAWTHEVVGAGSNDNGLEGEVYGFYGMWYICWNQVGYFMFQLTLTNVPKPNKNFSYISDLIKQFVESI